jgi:hypothetical protein
MPRFPLGKPQSARQVPSRSIALCWLLAPVLACAFPVRHENESTREVGESLRATVNETTARVAARKPRFDRLPRAGDLYYECVALPGLANTTLCLFNIRILMSAALSRVSYYSENEKRVLSDAEMLEQVKQSKALGFNLPVPTVIDFAR